MKNESYNNEMDWLDDLLTESSDEETFIESLFDDEDYILEKASSMEYNIRRFKQQYKFDPKTSTIEVDGKRYKVDMNINQTMTHAEDKDLGVAASMPRNLSADIGSKDDPKIYLTKTFFQLKDDSRRAAILQHEIGHMKLHSTIPGYKYTDTTKISKKMVMDEIDRCCNNLENTYKKLNVDQSEIDSAVSRTRKILIQNINKEYLNSSTATELQSKIRADARKAANNLLPKNIPEGINPSHINANELEADRYAANRTSEKALKRGLRENYTKTKKNIDKTLSIAGKTEYMNNHNTPIEKRNSLKVSKPDRIKALTTDAFGNQSTTIDELKKNSNRSDAYDYKVRSKALKDKDLRNAKALK